MYEENVRWGGYGAILLEFILFLKPIHYISNTLDWWRCVGGPLLAIVLIDTTQFGLLERMKKNQTNVKLII